MAVPCLGRDAVEPDCSISVDGRRVHLVPLASDVDFSEAIEASVDSGRRTRPVAAGRSVELAEKMSERCSGGSRRGCARRRCGSRCRSEGRRDEGCRDRELHHSEVACV
jgi:hypothetical protein